MDTEETAEAQTPATSALREAIRQSGLSFREIARRSGTDIGILSRFMNASRSITLDTADKIIESLSLDVDLKARRKRKGR